MFFVALSINLYLELARHVELYLFYFHPPTLRCCTIFWCFIAFSLISIEHGHFPRSYPLVQ